ncbi:ferredoxin family protein [uncultured Methanosphaera sp.]|uniref:4Fe-4S dicluster domain-containing protein n=1 Tax=uncultured Methanosphaera sp. TaxID=262501 RepID=UPI000DC23591|nr:ferredoxin family protein [uncultured Methanosphaera sp.]RAP45587.1 MAG: ferredoxin [Methanosphaera sp. SHI1033]
MNIIVDYMQCIGFGCLECLDICPMNVFDFTDVLVVSRPDDCCRCDACLDVCPRGAISFE